MFSLSKTEDIVFRRPGLRHFMNPPPVNNFEQVGVVNLANLLSIVMFVLSHKFVMYFKMCSQWVYLLKVRREFTRFVR